MANTRPANPFWRLSRNSGLHPCQLRVASHSLPCLASCPGLLPPGVCPAPCYLASAAVSSFPSPITGSSHGRLPTREARRGLPKLNFIDIARCRVLRSGMGLSLEEKARTKTWLKYTRGKCPRSCVGVVPVQHARGEPRTACQVAETMPPALVTPKVKCANTKIRCCVSPQSTSRLNLALQRKKEKKRKKENGPG
ncbi:uncharacterized protein LY79DRAFT_211702 [Colletotrichum navitas]|uniref:Uncharacterized protein n=1 Tax=Colletotrichum navitas TaxID=681940 RepID=A0AAD8QAX8_9PEZI|nr:uncharacterized protein LY79DRAFT_211702 [Colletotrichum navitas]KAK1599182.1 hypothetical protein LY79DRAFT_211702 [Colletotrichum navitas]